MFQRLPDLTAGGDPHPPVVTIDGRTWIARGGDSVAATLLAAGLADCRTTPVTGAARGPYCMMGVCFDCLVVIDGKESQQGCMVVVRDGMRIARQRGARGVPTVVEEDATISPACAWPAMFVPPVEGGSP